MQYRAFLSATLFAAAFTTSCFAQGPVGDEVVVTFDRQVQVGSQTLSPGKYTIRQVTSASNPRVLEFTSDNGTKLDATVTAIPVLQNTPPSETKVILDDEHGAARLARIWVQGKSYGYEFPGSATSTGTTTTAGVTLEGRYVAQAQTTPAPAPVAQTTPPPAAPPARAVEPERPAAPPAEIAQTRPPEPAPAPTPAPAPETPASAVTGIPSTALGWLPITLIGLLMAASGLFLYWRERTNN